MKHFASPSFWSCYDELPIAIRRLADKCYELMKQDPYHPSIQLKKMDKFHTARIGLHYRALAVEVQDGLLWFWIGTHAEYDKLVK